MTCQDITGKMPSYLTGQSTITRAPEFCDHEVDANKRLKGKLTLEGKKTHLNEKSKNVLLRKNNAFMFCWTSFTHTLEEYPDIQLLSSKSAFCFCCLFRMVFCFLSKASSLDILFYAINSQKMATPKFKRFS